MKSGVLRDQKSTVSPGIYHVMVCDNYRSVLYGL